MQYKNSEHVQYNHDWLRVLHAAFRDQLVKLVEPTSWPALGGGTDGAPHASRAPTDPSRSQCSVLVSTSKKILGFQDNYISDPLRTVWPKKQKHSSFEQSYSLLSEGVSFVAGQEAPKGVKTLRNTPAPAPDLRSHYLGTVWPKVLKHHRLMT